MKLLLGFAGSTQPTTSAAISRYPYAVGAASAAIKIRGSPYHIAPEGAPTEAEPLRMKNPSMCYSRAGGNPVCRLG